MRISSAPDEQSETLSFLGEDMGPPDMYELITDVVYSAKFVDEYAQISLEDIPPYTKIGVAVLTSNHKFVDLDIDKSIFDEYGVESS